MTRIRWRLTVICLHCWHSRRFHSMGWSLSQHRWSRLRNKGGCWKGLKALMGQNLFSWRWVTASVSFISRIWDTVENPFTTRRQIIQTILLYPPQVCGRATVREESRQGELYANCVCSPMLNIQCHDAGPHLGWNSDILLNNNHQFKLLVSSSHFLEDFNTSVVTAVWYHCISYGETITERRKVLRNKRTHRKCAAMGRERPTGNKICYCCKRVCVCVCLACLILLEWKQLKVYVCAQERERERETVVNSPIDAALLPCLDWLFHESVPVADTKLWGFLELGDWVLRPGSFCTTGCAVWTDLLVLSLAKSWEGEFKNSKSASSSRSLLFCLAPLEGEEVAAEVGSHDCEESHVDSSGSVLFFSAVWALATFLGTLTLGCRPKLPLTGLGWAIGS